MHVAKKNSCNCRWVSICAEAVVPAPTNMSGQPNASAAGYDDHKRQCKQIFGLKLNGHKISAQHKLRTNLFNLTRSTESYNPC